MSPVYEPSEAFAARLDERDPLARFRELLASLRGDAARLTSPRG